MAIDWNHELVDQLEWHWSEHLRPRLAGLTDEEYLWEPAAGMWSIRSRGESTAPIQVGAGDNVIEFAVPEPVPAPLTTIAWRMGHIAIGVFGERAANHFGAGGVSYDGTDWPLTAAGGLDLLDHHHDAWVAGVRALGAEGLARPCGPHEGPFAEHPLAALVLHINREALHHGAEVLLLRDLYVHRADLAPRPHS
jgi:hypothetical protein